MLEVDNVTETTAYLLVAAPPDHLLEGWTATLTDTDTGDVERVVECGRACDTVVLRLRPGAGYIVATTLHLIPVFGELEVVECSCPGVGFRTLAVPELFRCVVCGSSTMEVAWVTMGNRDPCHAALLYECELWDSFGVIIATARTEYNTLLLEDLKPCTPYCFRVRSLTKTQKGPSPTYGPFSAFRTVTTLASWAIKVVTVSTNSVTLEMLRKKLDARGSASGPMRPPELSAEYARDGMLSMSIVVREAVDDDDEQLLEAREFVEEVDFASMKCTVLGLSSGVEYVAKAILTLETTATEEVEDTVNFLTRSVDDSFTDTNAEGRRHDNMDMSVSVAQGGKKGRRIVTKLATVHNPCLTLRLHHMMETAAIVKWARGDIRLPVFGMNFSFRLRVMKLPRGMRGIPLWFMQNKQSDPHTSPTEGLLYADYVKDFTFHGDTAGYEIVSLDPDARYAVNVCAYDVGAHGWMPWSPTVCFVTLRRAQLTVDSVDLDHFHFSFPASVLQEEAAHAMMIPGTTLHYEDYNWQKLQKRMQVRVIMNDDTISSKRGGKENLEQEGRDALIDVSDKRSISVPRNGMDADARFCVRARLMLYDTTSWTAWCDPIYFLLRSVHHTSIASTVGGLVAVTWPRSLRGQLSHEKVSEEDIEAYLATRTVLFGSVSIVFDDGQVVRCPMVGSEGGYHELEAAEVVFPSVATGAYKLRVLVLDTIANKAGYDIAAAIAATPYVKQFHELERFQALIVQASENEVTIQCAPFNLPQEEPTAVHTRHHKRTDLLSRLQQQVLSRFTKRNFNDFPSLPANMFCLQNMKKEDDKVIRGLLKRLVNPEGHTFLDVCPDVKHIEVCIEGTTRVSRVYERKGRGITITGLETHTPYNIIIRPVLLNAITSVVTSEGHWSTPMPFITARRLLLSCDSVGKNHMEISWIRPLPWAEKSSFLALDRTMTACNTVDQRGVQKVALSSQRKFDLREERPTGSSVVSDSYTSSIYSIKMPFEIIVTLQGAPVQWQLYLHSSSSAVFLGDLRESSQFKIRIRQIDGLKKTQWSRFITIQTITKINIAMTAMGADYCCMHCSRREMLDPASLLGATGMAPGESFLEAQSSDDDLEVDSVSSYEIAVELHETHMFPVLDSQEFVPTGLGGGEKSLTITGLRPDSHYFVKYRVKSDNLWGLWEQAIEFTTMPLLTLHLVRACEDRAEVRYNAIPDTRIFYVDAEPPSTEPLFALTEMYAVIKGKFLNPRQRHVFKDIDAQAEQVLEHELLVSLTREKELHIIEGLLPDQRYTVTGYYVDARQRSCARSRCISFLTFPVFDLHTAIIGETYLSVNVTRRPRRPEHEDLIRDDARRALAYDSVMHEQQQEMHALEALCASGKINGFSEVGYTLAMHQWYVKLLDALAERDGFLLSNSGRDVGFQMDVMETRAMSFDILPSRDQLLTVLVSNFSPNIDRRSIDNDQTTQFMISELQPDCMYNSLVRSISQWAEGSVPWQGMWSDIISHHTLRPVLPTLTCLSEDWALVVIARPLSAYNVSSTTLYQFAINGVPCNKTLVLPAGEKKHLLFDRLLPATEYLITARTTIKEEDDAAAKVSGKWSSFQRFLVVRTIPLRPTHITLYEFRDGYMSLHFRDGKSGDGRRKSWSSRKDEEDEWQKEGPPPLVRRHTFHSVLGEEQQTNKAVRDALLDRYTDTIEIIDNFSMEESMVNSETMDPAPSDLEDYYEIEMAMATASPRRELRRFVSMGCVPDTFARIQLPSGNVRIHELQFRVSARNRFVEESLKTAPMDKSLPEGTWRTRSMFSATVGWEDPSPPPPITHLTMRIRGTFVDLTWCYPSSAFHNQLYFSVRVQQVSVDGWWEAARVRETAATLRGLSNVAHRLWVVSVSTFGTGRPEQSLRFTPRMDVRDTLQHRGTDEAHEISASNWDWVFPNPPETDYAGPHKKSVFHLRDERKMEARRAQPSFTLYMPPRAAWLPQSRTDAGDDPLSQGIHNAAETENEALQRGLVYIRGDCEPSHRDGAPPRSILRSPMPNNLERSVFGNFDAEKRVVLESSLRREQEEGRRPSSLAISSNEGRRPSSFLEAIREGLMRGSIDAFEEAPADDVPLTKIKFTLPTEADMHRATFGEMADRCLSRSPGITPSPTPSPAVFPPRKPSPRPPTPADNIFGVPARPVSATPVPPTSPQLEGVHRALRVKTMCVDRLPTYVAAKHRTSSVDPTTATPAACSPKHRALKPRPVARPEPPPLKLKFVGQRPRPASTIPTEWNGKK